MKIRSLLALVLLAFGPAAFTGRTDPPPRTDYPTEAIPFTQVRIDDAFWSPRIEANRLVSVPYLLKASAENGQLLDVEPTYKTIEGAAYTLMLHPDARLEADLDVLIDKIIARLIPRNPAATWTETSWDLDLYPAGHFIEAAIAHHQATGKKKMLDAALTIADRLVAVYGPAKRHRVPNHEEIEIALIRLFRLTGQDKYLELAKFFLDERGRDSHPKLGENAQDHVPVVEQNEAVGHCVMAVYLYAAMTDIAALTNDAAYRNALAGLWDDTVSGKTYLTGGIGAVRFHERFGARYELPNQSGWAETCAAYGNALWNHRLFLLTRDGRYVDLMERILYNGFLVGVSLTGDRFFYQNPLKSFGQYERFAWINVPCCPPNVVRLLATLGSYIYARSGNDLYINLFVAGRADVNLDTTRVSLVQETRYPWEGAVRVTVNPERPGPFTVNVRIPGWTRGQVMPGDLYRFLGQDNGKVRLAVNGQSIAAEAEKGFIGIRRDWKRGDVIELDLPMPVRRIVARDEVRENAGRAALSRGPIVYCAEWPDNAGTALNLVLPDEANLAAEFRPDLLGGIGIVSGNAAAMMRGPNTGPLRSEPRRLVAIPYYAWANRGRGEMAVWLPRRADGARVSPIPLPEPVIRLSSFGTLEKRQTGYNDQSDDISAIHDGVEPFGSADESSLYFRMKPPAGQPAWVEYEFKSPTVISSSEVYWVDDRRFCRLPEAWKILVDDGGSWKRVVIHGAYGVEKDRFNRVTFDPVKARAVRIEVEPQEIPYQAGRGGPPDAMPIKEDVVWREFGIIEWRVK
jgi:hypothetical protein